MVDEYGPSLFLFDSQKFEEGSLKERRVDQTRVDAEGLVEGLLADLKPAETAEECKYMSHAFRRGGLIYLQKYRPMSVWTC